MHNTRRTTPRGAAAATSLVVLSALLLASLLLSGCSKMEEAGESVSNDAQKSGQNTVKVYSKSKQRSEDAMGLLDKK